MKITLFYRGPLKSNADARIKHQLRLHFHPQLERALLQTPYMQRRFRDWDKSVVLSKFYHRNAQTVAGHTFLALAAPHLVPMSTEERHEVSVELGITMLRAGPLGSLIVGGGDIDNRLKTLFDALQIPDQNQGAKLNTTDLPGSPMFCLMSDDKLITRVNVQTGQLLDVDDRSKEIVLIIHAEVTGGGLQ